MTPDPIALGKDDLISKARTLMIQWNIDHLPILDEKAIAGIVTSDAIVLRMSPLEKIAPHSLIAEEQDD